MTVRTASLLLPVMWLTACGGTEPPAPLVRERGIESQPARVILSCVTPGCDTTTQITVRLVGDRRLAIKRLVLSEGAQSAFSFTPSQPAPFILGVDSAFTIDLRYAPKEAPVAEELYLAVTYTDASPIESEDRVEPGELRIPLVRRLVGQPALTAKPTRLAYGVVEVDGEKSLPLKVENDGFGNVAVRIASIDAGHPELWVSTPSTTTLMPDAGVELDVTWKPKLAAYLHSQVVVSAGTSELEPTVVEVEGTSLPEPKIALLPEGNFNFRELPRKQLRRHTVELMNQGGKDLEISAVTVNDPTGTVKAFLPEGKSTLTLAPLQRAPLKLELEGTVAGPVEATVSIASNDLATTQLDLQVTGTVTEPRAQLSPESVDFGTVPMGWVVSRSVEVKNVGHGALTVKNIMMVGGSSNLFKVKTLPSLPFVLERDQRVAVDVEFRAEAGANFTGFLSVESDDPEKSFREVTLQATSGDCNTGCPITNGTPSCTGGVCAVGACNTGYYDADLRADNGCECKEVGQDPGTFCAQGIYKGTLKDKDKAQANHTGIIPTADDVDMIRFFAQDETNFLSSDDWKVRVRLQSNDPGITMCVYRHNTGSHNNECYLNNEVCGKTYYKSGTNSSDDADFTVKVFRVASSPPSCTSYTVFMSNGL